MEYTPSIFHKFSTSHIPQTEHFVKNPTVSLRRTLHAAPAQLLYASSSTWLDKIPVK